MNIKREVNIFFIILMVVDYNGFNDSSVVRHQ